MGDNVIKFRRPEKKPDQPVKKPDLPGWVPWLGLVVLAMAIYGVQQSGLVAGLFGGAR